MNHTLELTDGELRLLQAALHSYLDDFGHDERDVVHIAREVLDKLPDEHAIRAIQLDQEIEHQLSASDASGDEPPPAA